MEKLNCYMKYVLSFIFLFSFPFGGISQSVPKKVPKWYLENVFARSFPGCRIGYWNPNEDLLWKHPKSESFLIKKLGSKEERVKKMHYLF